MTALEIFWRNVDAYKAQLAAEVAKAVEDAAAPQSPTMRDIGEVALELMGTGRRKTITVPWPLPSGASNSRRGSEVTPENNRRSSTATTSTTISSNRRDSLTALVQSGRVEVRIYIPYCFYCHTHVNGRPAVLIMGLLIL